MGNRCLLQCSRSHIHFFISLCCCLLLLAACGSQATTTTAIGTTTPTTRQTLVLPNVGTQDLDSLDPTQAQDANALLALNMLYSGLVRLDQQLNVIPDQASWTISADRKTYTFQLKPDLTFSDGTPITAQSYVYSLTRALLPETNASNAMLLLGNIAGAAKVNSGKATTLSGVRAINDQTLQITLTTPTEYFLQALASPLAFVVNQKVVGTEAWTNRGGGSGPFVVKTWQHNTRMVLVPNAHYYGAHTRLQEVDMIFAVDAHDAFQAYQGGQYNFVWNLDAADLNAARGLAGFTSQAQLQTDALFFDTQTPPFDQAAVRQAFAYAIDKNLLAQSTMINSVVPAPTIIPEGIPNYQPALTSLDYDRAKALASLQTVYPDASEMPQVTFFYPSSLVSTAVATTLQQMWQTALGIQVKLVPEEAHAYYNELSAHHITFGFAQWNADFPDPYDALALNLLSGAPQNWGQWQNQQFDQLIQQAEQASGSGRLDLYAQAEQIALNDVGWLPLYHQTLAAIIPATVHGVTLTHMGLYFGDWSQVYLSAR
ncbi:MAG TPA: peptide ABC transporter substrate-binding protein [Ktedonobacteraceae bacterium]|nr:peptide ABC transporter substrate-binding protein [Ktedonobacteraceae bacterium]